MIEIEQIEEQEFAYATELVARGRQAAALDGNHLITWGSLCGVALVVQYFAEVGDWASSNILWLWQPVLILCFVISIFSARSGAGRRLANPVSRAYSSVFLAAGLLIATFLVANGIDERPKPLITATLVPALLASAFFVLAFVTSIRWMFLTALGWWAAMAYFATRDNLVPIDFLVLAGCCFALLALPGALLRLRVGVQ